MQNYIVSSAEILEQCIITQQYLGPVIENSSLLE